VLGKAATDSQFGAVAALILNEPAAWPLALSALALGILALADYIRRAVLISRRRQQAEERKQ
jgi:hypothetical protein